MMGTRMGLQFYVGKLAQFFEDPKGNKWMAVKYVLIYVRGTSSNGIVFDGSSGVNLYAYCDAQLIAMLRNDSRRVHTC